MEENKFDEWKEWAHYVVKGIERIDKTIDKLDSSVDELQKRVVGLEVEQGKLLTAFEKFDSNMDDLQKRVVALEVEQGKLSTAFKIKTSAFGVAGGILAILCNVLYEMVKKIK